MTSYTQKAKEWLGNDRCDKFTAGVVLAFARFLDSQESQQEKWYGMGADPEEFDVRTKLNDLMKPQPKQECKHDPELFCGKCSHPITDSLPKPTRIELDYGKLNRMMDAITDYCER